MKRLIFLLSFATLAMISTAQTYHPYPDQKASPPGTTYQTAELKLDVNDDCILTAASFKPIDPVVFASLKSGKDLTKVMELKSDGTLHIYDINQVKAIAINGRIYRILPPTLEDVTDKPNIRLSPGTGITFTPDGTIHGLSFPADPLRVDTSKIITRSIIFPDGTY